MIKGMTAGTVGTMIVRVSVELKVRASKDPQELAREVRTAVEQGCILGEIHDVRYSVLSGHTTHARAGSVDVES